jgi:putative ABC transport system permease protein
VKNLLRDVRFGARMLRKNPGFTCAAVAVLALGFGANTAIFSLVNAFLLKPLVMQTPADLVGCYRIRAVKPRTLGRGYKARLKH